MKQISLQEYANLEGISLVTVNKRVNKGLVQSEKIGNRRYILINDDVVTNNKDDEVKEDFANPLIKYLEVSNKKLTKINKQLNKDLEIQKKEIARLNKQLNKEKDNTSNIYLRYINQLENNQIRHNKVQTETDIEDVEIVKKKKKKKK